MPDFFNFDVFAVNAEMVVVPMSTMGAISHNFADPLNAKNNPKVFNTNIRAERDLYTLDEDSGKSCD
jgi:hypothetical protein